MPSITCILCGSPMSPMPAVVPGYDGPAAGSLLVCACGHTTPPQAPETRKHIDADNGAFFDGALIGYYRTREAARLALNSHVTNLVRRRLV